MRKSRPTTHTYIYCTRIGEDTEWAATHCARADSRLNDCVTRENERGIKKEIQIPWLASKVSGLAFYYHFGGGGKVYPDFRTVARRVASLVPSQSSPSHSIGISEIGITISNDAFLEKREACWAGKMEMESVQSIPRLKQSFA